MKESQQWEIHVHGKRVAIGKKKSPPIGGLIFIPTSHKGEFRNGNPEINAFHDNNLL